MTLFALGMGRGGEEEGEKWEVGGIGSALTDRHKKGFLNL